MNGTKNYRYFLLLLLSNSLTPDQKSFLVFIFNELKTTHKELLTELAYKYKLKTGTEAPTSFLDAKVIQDYHKASKNG